MKIRPKKIFEKKYDPQKDEFLKKFWKTFLKNGKTDTPSKIFK